MQQLGQTLDDDSFGVLDGLVLTIAFIIFLWASAAFLGCARSTKDPSFFFLILENSLIFWSATVSSSEIKRRRLIKIFGS